MFSTPCQALRQVHVFQEELMTGKGTTDNEVDMHVAFNGGSPWPSARLHTQTSKS